MLLIHRCSMMQRTSSELHAAHLRLLPPVAAVALACQCIIREPESRLKLVLS